MPPSLLSLLLPCVTVLCCLGLAWAVKLGLPLELALPLAGLLPGADRLVKMLRPSAPSLDFAGLDQLAQLADRWAQSQAPALQGAAGELRRVAGLPLPPPPRPRPGEPIVLALLLPLLALSGCATTWGAALAACGLQQAPQAASSAVALALHKADGWEAALAGLVGTYSRCVIDALVLKHAQGQGDAPPQVAAVAEEPAPLEARGLVGEVAAAHRPPPVTREEAQRRARDWLGHRR